MTTPAFAAAIAQLEREASEQRSAIMCAEAVPWRCHRNLIADALVAAGNSVLHIGDAGVTVHQLTKFAVITPSGSVLYPAAQSPKLLSLLGE